MRERLGAIAGVVGTLAVIGGVVAVPAGGLLFLLYVGQPGLAALGALVGVLLAAVGGAFLFQGALLRRASRAVGETAADAPPPSPALRGVSTIVTAGVAVAWVWAAVASSAMNGINPTVLIAAAIAIALGLGAWVARYLAGRSVGSALLLIAVLGTVPGVGMAQSLTRDLSYRQDVQAEQARRDLRYAPLKQGPTAGDLAAAVGTVGTWQPITGGVYPDFIGDEWPYLPRDALATLRGQRVQFAVVGQCWIDGPKGELSSTVWLATARTADGFTKEQLAMPTMPCDGPVHGVVSDPHLLAEWFDTSHPFVDRQEWLVATADAVQAPGAGPRLSGDVAVRWLLFVSPVVASPIDDVVAAVAGHLHPLILE